MEGYTKMLVTDFPVYNKLATARIQSMRPDPSLTQYTYAIPDDEDSRNCWAREEALYTDLMTPQEKSVVKSRNDPSVKLKADAAPIMEIAR